MQITIKLYAMLRSYLKNSKNGVATIACTDGATIAAVLQELGLPEKMPKILLVNGEQKEPGDALSDGDVLSVFPPMAGG